MYIKSKCATTTISSVRNCKPISNDLEIFTKVLKVRTLSDFDKTLIQMLFLISIKPKVEKYKNKK